MADLFRPVGTVTAFKDIGIPPSTRPHGISRQSFLVYPLDLHMRITVAFLDFVTFGPLILRMRLGIKFLFVRLRFRYPFFSPTPHDINLGNRFKVRRQLRPGGLSPQTDGMPVIPKTAIRNASALLTGVPGRARTAGVPLRRRTLYPTEVQRRVLKMAYFQGFLPLGLRLTCIIITQRVFKIQRFEISKTRCIRTTNLIWKNHLARD